MPDWLSVQRGDVPLILAIPHGGTWFPPELSDQFISPWAARRDCDWHIAELYAGLVGASVIATTVSRSVIDVNRDPSGASLYPGQATTELCPTTDFDGAPLYRAGMAPEPAEIAARRVLYFDPYHTALADEIARLRRLHPRIVVYDCHSIRSLIPRLFDGVLPEFNIGTNLGATCAPALVEGVMAQVRASGRSYVCDGRFRGGWTTRRYGDPADGVHAIQMELAMRAYLREPAGKVRENNWPPEWDAGDAEMLRETLTHILVATINFAGGPEDVGIDGD